MDSVWKIWMQFIDIGLWWMDPNGASWEPFIWKGFFFISFAEMEEK